MTRRTFEQLRLPAALVLLLAAGFVLLPRAEETSAPSPSVVVGEPGGEVLTPEPEPSPTGAPTPIPTVVPVASPTPTAQPTPTAAPTPRTAADGFSAEVLACRSISGSNCNDQLGTLPANAATFTALVRFTDSNAGDTINAVLTGPSGTISGGAYTLQGGGDGYYYSTFQAGGLPGGTYTLTATRNGTEVAETSFQKAGG